MSSSYPSRRLPALIATVAVTAGLTLSTVGLAGPAQAVPTPKKKYVPPKAVSWVGGADLIGTRVLTDLPAGVKKPPAPKAVSWLVADLDTREILAAKNVHVPLAQASTMKIFTSLALAPQLDPKQVYTGRIADSNIDGTKVGIVAGSKYTVDDLLHGMLMSSGNDCANALGNLVGGNAKAVALMQQKAQSLGAFDTVVRNTSGLDASGQVSSAYDLALAGSAALQDKQLAKIMTTPVYRFPDKGKSLGTKRKRYQTQNHNRLLGYLPGVTGIKNGYTTKALGSNVASARYKGHNYIAVMMRADGLVFTPSGDLLQWAFKYGQKANPVGQLVEPGELDAMTGPDVAPTQAPDQALSAQSTPSPGTTTPADEAVAGGSDDLSAALPSAAVSDQNAMVRFWPVVVVGVLLAAAVIFGLRPIMANSRRARVRRMRGRRRH